MSVFNHIRFAAKSDIGRKRKNNEDSFGIFPASGIFCVADGMGGGDDGEVASAATVREVQRFCESHPFPRQVTYTREGILSGIRASVNSASAWIFRRARERALKGCGSTFVGVVFDASHPDQAVALHAGDSRLYRIRGRTIQQVTTDHSAAELIGAKDEKDINPMFRGMILRAVGIQPSVELQMTEFPVREGDRILICSDGLSRMVPDKQLLALIRANLSLENAVDALIAAANAAGGVDNITVELIEIGALPEALPAIPLPTTVATAAVATAPATSATWTSSSGAETSETAGGNGTPPDSESSEDLFSVGPTTDPGGDEEQTGSTMTIPEAADDDDSTEDNAPATPKMLRGTVSSSRNRRWIGYSAGILLLLGGVAGTDYFLLRNGGNVPENPEAPATTSALKFLHEKESAEAEAEKTAIELVETFRLVSERHLLLEVEKDWSLWQERWSSRLDAEKYRGLKEQVLASRNEAEKRILLGECEESVEKSVTAFLQVQNRTELAKLESDWRVWRTTWKAKVEETRFADFDGKLKAARDTAEQRIADEEKRIAEEKAKAETERLLAECRKGADELIDTFGKAKTQETLDKAVVAHTAWQEEWKERVRDKKGAYAAQNDRIQTAHTAAQKRIEAERVCKESAEALVRGFQSAKSDAQLKEQENACRNWRKKWEGKIDEKAFDNLHKTIREMRDEIAERLANEAAIASQEAERNRANVRKTYELALTNEPVEQRGKRLEDAKEKLAASKERSLFSEAETERMLAEIERRRSWTVGKIANRTGNAVTVDGTNIAAGTTATVVFEKGTSWPVTRKGYEPGTVKRESLDGETVTLADDAFVPSEVTVKLPDGLDAGVVCDLDGRVVGAAGVPVNPGRHICAYRRAGYDPQEGISFDVAVGATDARFPKPEKWVASPVNVTIPKLESGVTCEVDGRVQKGGEVFALRLGKKYPYTYRKAGYEDQKGEISVEVNKQLALPKPGTWKPAKTVEKSLTSPMKKPEQAPEGNPVATQKPTPFPVGEKTVSGEVDAKNTDVEWKKFVDRFIRKKEAFFEVLATDMKNSPELLQKLSSAAERLHASARIDEGQCEEIWELLRDVVSLENEYAAAELDSISGNEVTMSKYRRIQDACTEFFSGKDEGTGSKISRMTKFVESVTKKDPAQK